MWVPPPPPPRGPENRVQCSSCGFMAPKSEFEREHGSGCRHGAIVFAIVVGAAAVLGIGMIILAKVLT